jgi:hypothetical protein
LACAIAQIDEPISAAVAKRITRRKFITATWRASPPLRGCGKDEALGTFA